MSRQRANEGVQTWGLFRWMKCLLLLGNFCLTKRAGGRGSPPQLSFVVSAFLCWAWKGRESRQSGVVVQSTRCESGKTGPLFHVHHDLNELRWSWAMSTPGLPGLEPRPSWTRELNCLFRHTNRTLAFPGSPGQVTKVEWRRFSRERSFRTGRLSWKKGWFTWGLLCFGPFFSPAM